MKRVTKGAHLSALNQAAPAGRKPANGGHAPTEAYRPRRDGALPHSPLGPVTTPLNRPRVCMLSQRGLSRVLARCCGYEFEDVVSAIDDVDLIAPGHTRTSRLRLKARSRLSRYTPLYRSISSGLRAEMPQPTYDLFFALVQFSRDLLWLDAIPGWRRRCGSAVCVIEELWAADIERLGPQLNVLKKFDHVFCGCAGSLQPLSERLQRPVHHLPPGVDAIRFCPDPLADRRGIDICAIGRNSPSAHAALLAYANATGAFYHFDSLDGLRSAKVPHEHRMLLGNLIKHSRYFIVHRAKFNREFETGEQEEIGFRFFEGLAGGAVLLGDRPQTPIFDALMGWEDSVIVVQLDSPHLADIIGALDAQPERLDAIRRRNVCNSLRRHDWFHRWSVVLDRVGLKAGPRMESRGRDLATLSAQFDDENRLYDPRLSGEPQSSVVSR